MTYALRILSARSAIAIAVIAGSAFVLTGCGGSSPATSPTQPIATAITLSAGDLALDVGQASQITAIILDQNSSQLTGVSAAFSSTNPAIATTTSGGLVTGVSPGTTTIRAVVGSISKELPVVVRALPHVSTSRVQISSRPFGAAVSSTGTILVTQQDADALTRLELSTLGSGVRIGVGTDPGDVVFDPSGNTAFVTNFLAGTLGRVDLVTGQQTKTLNTAGNAFRVLLSADARKLFVTSGAGQLWVVDPSTFAALATIPIPANPNGIAQIGDRLYVSSSSSGSITEINTTTNSVGRTLNVGGRPQDIAASADGTELYVANELGTVTVVTMSTGAVATQIAVDGGAFGLALAPDGYLYVSLSDAGKVVVIDPKTRSIRATVVTGGMPRRIAPDPKGTAIIVPNEGGWADVLR